MKTIITAACLISVVLSIGCVASTDPGEMDDDEQLSNVVLAAGGINGLHEASVRIARLTTNPAPRQELLGHPLTGAGLTTAVKIALVGDAASDELMSYIVKCALGADQDVAFTHGGVARRYQGQHGLGGRWSTGACGEQCREWVSACVIAHVNHSGISQPINLVAAPFMPDGGYEGYPHEEATYWGDIFDSDANQKRFGCVNDALRISRVCGSDPVTCGGFLQGSGRGGALQACSTTCRSALTDGGQANSTYYSGCVAAGVRSGATMTIWRND